MTERKLNRVLKLNAAFSALCAVDLLLFSELIAGYMGGFSPIYLQVIAVGLIGFAGVVLWISQQQDNLEWAMSIVHSDRAWVIGSILLLIFGHSWFSSAGLLMIGGVAVIVAGFGETQYKYIREANQQKSTLI